MHGDYLSPLEKKSHGTFVNSEKFHLKVIIMEWDIFKGNTTQRASWEKGYSEGDIGRDNNRK